MALPATDSFTDTTGTQLTTHSASWTLNGGDLDIQSNALAPDSAGDAMAHWNADAFNDDQYAEATCTSVDAYGIGVSVRCHASAFTGYVVQIYAGDLYMGKFIAGAWTSWGSGSTLSVPDDIRIEVSGTTITPLLNGVEDDPPGAQTDASIASGSAGVNGYGDSSDDRIDDWEGGNLAAGSESASESASVSPSASLSPSASQSPSASESASQSPSASESRSLSPSASESASESASPSPVVGLDVVWGHDTGVTQGNVRNFQGDWTGTGDIENPGVNDTERLALNAGEYMTGPIVDTGASIVRVTLNSYQAGDAVTVEYRTAGTPNACAVAAWVPYAAPFASNGYSQVKLTSTL